MFFSKAACSIWRTSISLIITRPPEGMAVGEAWLRALGDAIKIGVGVVLPLLLAGRVLMGVGAAFTPIAAAIDSRAASTASLARRPNPCVVLAALPNHFGAGL